MTVIRCRTYIDKNIDPDLLRCYSLLNQTNSKQSCCPTSPAWPLLADNFNVIYCRDYRYPLQKKAFFTVIQCEITVIHCKFLSDKFNDPDLLRSFEISKMLFLIDQSAFGGWSREYYYFNRQIISKIAEKSMDRGAGCLYRTCFKNRECGKEAPWIWAGFAGAEAAQLE